MVSLRSLLKIGVKLVEIKEKYSLMGGMKGKLFLCSQLFSFVYLGFVFLCSYNTDLVVIWCLLYRCIGMHPIGGNLS